MRRLTVFLVAVLVLSLAAPALAVPRPSPATDAPLRGDRINIVKGEPSAYPADTAFHIWDALFPDHVADLAEMRDAFGDSGIRAELAVDGSTVMFSEWFNVWNVEATCGRVPHERNLERISRAERFMRFADRWGCDAQGLWSKGYYHNYKRGLPEGLHDFQVEFFWDGGTTTLNHTVEFTS